MSDEEKTLIHEAAKILKRLADSKGSAIIIPTYLGDIKFNPNNTTEYR